MSKGRVLNSMVRMWDACWTNQSTDTECGVDTCDGMLFWNVASSFMIAGWSVFGGEEIQGDDAAGLGGAVEGKKNLFCRGV